MVYELVHRVNHRVLVQSGDGDPSRRGGVAAGDRMAMARGPKIYDHEMPFWTLTRANEVPHPSYVGHLDR